MSRVERRGLDAPDKARPLPALEHLQGWLLQLMAA
jgi:hypothetical protein